MRAATASPAAPGAGYAETHLGQANRGPEHHHRRRETGSSPRRRTNVIDQRTTCRCFVLAAALASGCGGGGSSGQGTPSPPASDNAARIAAAASTAQNSARCTAIGAFYWEIGDSSGALATGSVGTKSDGSAYKSTDLLNIASASKWPFAAYVIQKYGDVAANVPYLNFTSGYSNFDNSLCTPTQTVAQCNNGGINLAEATAATFHYEGGHMQQLAAVGLGLGSAHLADLASEVNQYIGSDVGLSYVEPQPPGGVRTSAASYAVFLRKLLAGSTTPLQLGALLNAHAVCTQPSATCNASNETAAKLPENFHYGLGHWIEDDPTNTPSSNFAYSSAGAFGFYPWVDVDRTLYGIVAQENQTGETSGTGEGYSSLLCGRQIRLAWKTATAQP